MFVDRDMFMQFRGGGIGHTISREWDKVLQADRRIAKQDKNEKFHYGKSRSQARTTKEHHEEDMDDREDDSGLRDVDDSSDDSEMGEQLESRDDDEEGDDGDEAEAEDPEDRIIADEGEELDEELFAQEGYDAL